MYRLERVAKERYLTSRPDGSTELLGRYTIVSVPARPCSGHLHSGPIEVYLEDLIFTEEERDSMLQSTDLRGGFNSSLPRQKDLITEVLGKPING